MDMRQAIRAAADRDRFADPLILPLQAACDRFDISATPQRVSAFLAQCAHESAGFRYLRELGGHDYLEKYDTGPLAARLGNTPEDDDDGQLYRGRGIIQITGRANYRIAGDALQLPLIENPTLAELPEHAALIAAWFWDSRKLNPLADADTADAFKVITRRINGGLNGLADRFARLNELREFLGLPAFQL